MSKTEFDERNLRSLRIFCAVAQAHGFAAAEKELNLSKASISRHIREVEEKLNTRLCERVPRGFELTRARRVALEVASSALRALDRIKPEIDAVGGLLSGTLAIGITEHIVTAKACRGPEAIAELRRRAPAVRTEVQVMSFAQLNQALRARRVEIVIRGSYRKERTFDYLPLFVETHRVYVRADAARCKAGTPLPLIYREHPFVDDLLEKPGFTKGPIAAGLEAIALLLTSGDYAGLLPEHYADKVGDHYPLSVVKGSPAYRNGLCAITEASRPISRNAELLLEILADLHSG
jgi:DNA-binding transcriptional LysR family regulator